MTDQTTQRQDEASAQLAGRLLAGLAGATILTLLLSLHSTLHGVAGIALLLTFAFLTTFIVWLRLRLQARAATEAWAKPEHAARSQSLFGSDHAEADPFSPQAALRRFETLALPLFTPLLMLLEAGAAVWLGRRLFAPMSAPDATLPAAGLMAGQAFGLYLAGKYLQSLSAHPARRLLKEPATAILVACGFSLLIMLTSVAVHAGFPLADRLGGLLIAALLALLALEHAARSLGQLYRMRGKPPGTPYASSLLQRLSSPAAWFAPVTDTLDYQFGLQLTRSRNLTLISRAVFPFIALQLALLYLLSCFVFLGPGEQGLRERLGRPVRADQPLRSGLHLKWPWPFERILRFPSLRVQRMRIGVRADDGHDPDVILWTEPHFRMEHRWLVPAEVDAAADEEGRGVPVSLLSIYMVVDYRISDLHRYAYQFSDAAQTLKQLAERSLMREVSARDLDELLSHGRRETAAAVHRRLQTAVEDLELGVEIEFVGLADIHPPMEVAEAFQSVVGAFEQRQSTVLTAEAYRNRRLPEARAEAAANHWEAEAYRFVRGVNAEAETQRFEQRLLVHRAAPLSYLPDYRLRVLERMLPDIRKFVIIPEAQREVLEWKYE